MGPYRLSAEEIARPLLSGTDIRKACMEYLENERKAIAEAKARGYWEGAYAALSWVRLAGQCGVNEALAKCPDTYRRAMRHACRAIECRLFHPPPGGGREE